MVLPNATRRTSAATPAPLQPKANLAPRATDTGSAARPSTSDLLTQQVTGAGGLPVVTGLPRPSVSTQSPYQIAALRLPETPNYPQGDGPPAGSPASHPSPAPGGHGVVTPGGYQGPGSTSGSGGTAQPGGTGGGGNTAHPGVPGANGSGGVNLTPPAMPTITAPQSTLYNAADLGKQYLADYDQANAQAEQNMYRQAGQYNAALGRLGSGMTQDDINSVTRNIDNDRLNFAYNAGQQERTYLTGQQAADRAYGLQTAGVSDQLANSDFMRRLQLGQFLRNGPNDSAASQAYLQAGQNASGAQTATGDLLSLYAMGQAAPTAPATPYAPQQPQQYPGQYGGY